jgi:hypothetical protein
MTRALRLTSLCPGSCRKRCFGSAWHSEAGGWLVPRAVCQPGARGGSGGRQAAVNGSSEWTARWFLAESIEIPPGKGSHFGKFSQQGKQWTGQQQSTHRLGYLQGPHTSNVHIHPHTCTYTLHKWSMLAWSVCQLGICDDVQPAGAAECRTAQANFSSCQCFGCAGCRGDVDSKSSCTAQGAPPHESLTPAASNTHTHKWAAAAIGEELHLGHGSCPGLGRPRSAA